jgi:hypothetical protein
LVPVLATGTHGISHPQLKKQAKDRVSMVSLTDVEYGPLGAKWEASEQNLAKGLDKAATNSDVWKIGTKVKKIKQGTLYRCAEYDKKESLVSQQSWCWFGRGKLAQIRGFFCKRASSDILSYPVLAELYLYAVKRDGEQVPTFALEPYTTHYAFVHELGDIVALFQNYVIDTSKDHATFYGGEGSLAPDPGNIVSNRAGSLTPVPLPP